MAEAICGQCGNESTVMVRVDAGFKLRLQRVGTSLVHAEVCDLCYKELFDSVSSGDILNAEQNAKEQQKLMLWKGRMSLVKQGRLLLNQKRYSEAAVSLEKYIRSLEIVYEQESGMLKPETFRNSAHLQELTVVASVFWDLMRIYDTNSKYLDRQMGAARKLSEFARFTPLLKTFLRQAESQSRSAKNPEAFREFLILSNVKRSRCFVASSAFNSHHDETVTLLCTFRDQILKSHFFGRLFILSYYKISPTLADQLDRFPILKPAVRAFLRAVAGRVARRFRLKQNADQ